MTNSNVLSARLPGGALLVSAPVVSRNALKIWMTPRAWFMLFPICYLIVQGHIQTGTVAEKLRLAEQSDSSMGRYAFMLMIAGTAVVVMLRFAQLLPKFLAVKDIVLLSFLAPLSVLWSDAPKKTALNGFGELAVALLAIYVVSEFTPHEQMQLVILPGFVAMLASFWIVFANSNIGMDAEEGGAWRGIFQEKNVLGLVVIFLAMPMIHLPIRGNIGKLFRLLYLSIALVLIGMSRSKTAWCVAILYVAFVAVLQGLRRFSTKDRTILSLLIGSGSLLLSGLIYQNSNSILQVLGKDPTLSERTVIWGAVWESITKRFVLGYGFEAFWRGLSGASLNVILTSGWMLSQAQNGYLDVWLSIGLVGIVILGLIVIQAVRDALTCLQLGRDEPILWYCGIILCALVYNIGESFLVDPRHICWFLFMMACVGLRSTASRLRTRSSQSGSYQYRPVAYPILVEDAAAVYGHRQ